MTDKAPPRALELAMAKLRDRFVDGLGPKAALLRKLAIEVGQGSHDAETAARGLAHQLAGTGASFGLPHVSVDGRLAEVASAADFPACLAQLIRTVEESVAAGRQPGGGGGAR